MCYHQPVHAYIATLKSSLSQERMSFCRSTPINYSNWPLYILANVTSIASYPLALIPSYVLVAQPSCYSSLVISMLELPTSVVPGATTSQHGCPNLRSCSYHQPGCPNSSSCRPPVWLPQLKLLQLSLAPTQATTSLAAPTQAPVDHQPGCPNSSSCSYH